MVGDFAGAAEISKGVLAQAPEMARSIRVLAFSRLRQGRHDEAIEILREAVARRRDTFLIRALCQAFIIAERYEEAEDALALYETVDPGDGRGPLMRGDILDRQGRPDAAIAMYEKAIRIDENRTGIVAEERIKRVRGR